MLYVIGAGALWAAWNGVVFTIDPATAHRAESAWFIFAGLLLIGGIMRKRWAGLPGTYEGRDAAVVIPGPMVLPALIAAALILFAPTLGVGLLSDDFVLLRRAGEGVLFDGTWEYVRPLPLALWGTVSAIVPASTTPLALHLLNVVLHGLNAWLVYRLARAIIFSATGALLAAALFLTGPFSVEPVVWASGIFDVLLTSGVLSAAVLMLTPGPAAATTVGLVLVITMLTVATKETAVAMPLLLALMIPFVPITRRRLAVASASASAAVVLVYLGWRVSLGLPESYQGIPSGYDIKELLSRPFGLLGLPIHANVDAAAPGIAAALAIAWPVLLVRAARTWHADARAFSVLGLACLWVLVSVLPVFTMLFIGDDLQGSRYLYLGSSVWSIALAVLIAGRASGPSGPAAIAAVCGLVVSSFLVLAHQQPWRAARDARDAVLAATGTVPETCDPAMVRGLPDNVAGAYVFRNGFSEAAAARGLRGTSPCAVEWNGTSFVVEPLPASARQPVP